MLRLALTPCWSQWSFYSIDCYVLRRPSPQPSLFFLSLFIQYFPPEPIISITFFLIPYTFNPLVSLHALTHYEPRYLLCWCLPYRSKHCRVKSQNRTGKYPQTSSSPPSSAMPNTAQQSCISASTPSHVNLPIFPKPSPLFPNLQPFLCPSSFETQSVNCSEKTKSVKWEQFLLLCFSITLPFCWVLSFSSVLGLILSCLQLIKKCSPSFPFLAQYIQQLPIKQMLYLLRRERQCLRSSCSWTAKKRGEYLEKEAMISHAHWYVMTRRKRTEQCSLVWQHGGHWRPEQVLCVYCW